MAPAPRRSRRTGTLGLPELRRRGAVTELLFLFECTTEEPAQLRPIADRLGVTVQAASHLFRQLAHRGLAEVREGRYRATIRGVAWLHRALGGVGEDVAQRLDRLNVIHQTRALALADLAEGTTVSLVLRDGLLSAAPGISGPSRGRVSRSARRGTLVTVDQLEGIVPIAPGHIRIVTLPVARLSDPALGVELRDVLPREGPALLGALGLEAYHLASRATDRPLLRFGVAAAGLEASRVGVDSFLVVLDEELPRLMQSFGDGETPALEVTSLGGGAPAAPRRAPSRRRRS
jgi:predicted transcriptional regulator